jgi:putative membrane-bound dehydrogenase-like protein
MIVRRALLVFSWIVSLGLLLACDARASEGDVQPGGTPPAPCPPAEAPGRMTVPDGFRVSLFAAEPDIVQPIAFTIDPKGRLWVVENQAYPLWLGGPQGKDRILIFEDADGDGRFDRRTVFLDKGTNYTGIELGFGGVWICATPNLLFVPDRDGDDRPDGPPSVVLDGWDTKAQHNMFNGLKWGPDGWLWGCNGILSNSRVGEPGAPQEARVPINCGVWRYHPTRKVFEAVAHGTTNPWGLDFDDHGEAFITNCVIPHLFHVVPGAHFQRMFGQDLNPNLFGLIETCADHIHWAGGPWTESREDRGNPKHSAAGGGHAHVGAMIYLGDNWPASYRNSVYTFNIHGHRVNHDRLERKGSTYVARHEPDFLMANDTWFRGLELKYGPDGAVYFTDWTDRGECHETDADNAHRENGRIYRLSFGNPRAVSVNLAAAGNEELARMQLHANEWYVRTARRLLQERAANGDSLTGVGPILRPILDSNPDLTRRLRALWTLYAIGGLDEGTLLRLVDDREESMSAWAVRLLVDGGEPSPRTRERFTALARSNRSPRVLLSLASALQRIATRDRWPIAEAMADSEIDPSDPMLPLMVWYGLEPLAVAEPARAVSLGAHARLPILRNYLARRALSVAPAEGLAALLNAMERAPAPAQGDLLAGALDGLRGRKQVPRPESWDTIFPKLLTTRDPEVLERVLQLALVLGEPRAIKTLRLTALDRESPNDLRRRALAALAERRVSDLPATLKALLDDDALRGAAIRALAAYDDPETPQLLLGRYQKLDEAERDNVIATLAARPAWALALLDAVGKKLVPGKDLSVTIARQLLALNDDRVRQRLEAVWGTVRPTSADKASLIKKFKDMLIAEGMSADERRGRVIYNRTCHQCHRLFDSGGDVGPELTGSDRANPDYILENVLDPSASVAREYTLTSVATSDGRLVSGIIREQNEQSLTIQTANERIVLPREDVEEIKPSYVSMMPEGQLDRLSPQEIRDLFAYLAASRQVPPADPPAQAERKDDAGR